MKRVCTSALCHTVITRDSCHREAVENMCEANNPWYSYFEKKPSKLLKRIQLQETTKQCMHSLDSFYLPLHTLSTLVGEKFVKWLCGSTGGGKGKGM